MATPTTVDEFFECVRKSGLLEPAKFEAFLASHPAGFETPAGAAACLLGDNLLTPFHTAQLLRGKHKGFFLGRYKILDRIGLGGMGQVFLAEHGTMRRRAALKVLPPDRSANEFSRARFLREARASAQLDHPNLVRAFDFDQDGDVTFLVMEYVDGVTFHDLVSRSGPLDALRAAHYVWQAANGLAYLHERGMIHRDIKPANILVDRQGVIKLLDLGLVRSDDDVDNLTRGEGVKILGTADYLPPEQAIDCSAVDRRADIYGLGATAYYLLTGRPPFRGEKVAQKLIAHQLEAVTPVCESRPDVPLGLSDAITRMLAKRPGDRFQSAGEVMDAVEEWAAHLPEPPSEVEIPAAVGAAGQAGTVHLGPRPSGRANPGLTSGSGSAIKYHSDPKLTAEESAALAMSGLDDGLAVLPAAASHGVAPPPLPARPKPRSGLPAELRPTPGAQAKSKKPRRALAVLALAASFAGVAWALVARAGAAAVPEKPVAARSES